MGFLVRPWPAFADTASKENINNDAEEDRNQGKSEPGHTSEPIPEATLVDRPRHRTPDGNPTNHGTSSTRVAVDSQLRGNKRRKGGSDSQSENFMSDYPSKRLSLRSESLEVVPHPDHPDQDHQEDDFDDDPGDFTPEPLRDLETRAITVPQLIQEVKGIYAGLVMVEKKCIDIVSQQVQAPTKLSKEQWQALLALHRTLLNEHHDFFSATHHPVTRNHELRDLAARYAMPARMWRHGIHAFLELLRHRLPESIEHMLAFIYLAYSMIGLLKETVPDFLETWIECLGDLARYRMAIEEADLRDREIWSNTARTWYNLAADLSPNTGRIQHHLAVLARPNIVSQLFLYSKALVAAVPFKNAGESILLLFNPLIDQTGSSTTRYQPADFSFVCAAAMLFRRRSLVEYDMYRRQFTSGLEAHMARSGSRFKIQGPEIAGALIAMVMDFGNSENTFWAMTTRHQLLLKQEYCKRYSKDPEKLPKDFVVSDSTIVEPLRQKYWSNPIENAKVSMPDSSMDTVINSSDQVTSQAAPLLYDTIADVAGQIGNKNVVPFMYMVLASLLALTYIPGALVYIEAFIPWERVVQFLNTVGRSGTSYENVESAVFPKSLGGGNKRQLVEDFIMRGLGIMTYYYPSDFFDKDGLVDEDERLLEQASSQAPRVERCLHAAIQLSTITDRWMSYDRETKLFHTTEFARKLVK